MVGDMQENKIASQKANKKPTQRAVMRKMNRKSRYQKEALWALYQKYDGQIPEPEEIEQLAPTLNMKKRTIYKWFWDTVKTEKARCEMVKKMKDE